MKNTEQTTDHETLLLLVQSFDNMQKGQDSFHSYTKEVLTRIEAQTVKTNGRVNSLEKWRSNSTGWVTGVGLCAGVIIGLCAYIFNYQLGVIELQESKTQDVLQTHISK